MRVFVGKNHYFVLLLRMEERQERSKKEVYEVKVVYDDVTRFHRIERGQGLRFETG